MVLFSHCTVSLPSVFSFHRVQLAACSPAPAFCVRLQVTTYLHGHVQQGGRGE